MKRSLSLLLVLALLAACCACAAQLEPAKPAEPELVAPAEPAEVEPTPEGTDEEPLVPPAAAFEPVAPTQQQLHEGEEMLVLDAFRYTYMYLDTDENGKMKTYEHNYGIPAICLPGSAVSELNDEILRTFYTDELIETVENNNENRGTLAPYYLGIDYSWARNDDLLSLAVHAETEQDVTEWYVCNVQVSSGQPVGTDEVLRTCGVSEADYLEKARLALSNAFWLAYSSVEPLDDPAIYEDCLQRTVSEDNLRAAVPYLDGEGALQLVGTFYFPAGTGQADVSVSLDQIDLCPSWAEHVVR